MDGTIKAIVKAAALGLVICLVILLYSTWTLLTGIEEMEAKEGLSNFKGSCQYASVRPVAYTSETRVAKLTDTSISKETLVAFLEYCVE